MLVISPAAQKPNIAIKVEMMRKVVDAIGTNLYGRSCLDAFAEYMRIEHLALYHYHLNNSVSCVATHSLEFASAAEGNVSKYQERCFKIDPAFLVARTDVRSPWIAKVTPTDISDLQYRHCFELTRVRERLSYFGRVGSDLYQISIFRGPHGMRSFSYDEIVTFSTLAYLVLGTAAKHELAMAGGNAIPEQLNLNAIERILARHSVGLSSRERQVCARVVAGMTIEGTAIDLAVKRTSVITYRQRAYQKLGVSRQTELVALVNNLRTVPTSRPNQARA
jgi:DNA-binding CsgD family transcriptional regulator